MAVSSMDACGAGCSALTSSRRSRTGQTHDIGGSTMRRTARLFATIGGMLLGRALADPALADPALAQKSGGILRVFHRDSPASMSIVEEGSISAIMPMMGVFNNLRSEE